jgi:hypothetical protein
VVQQMKRVLIDDLDGSPASGTVSFGLAGRHYEIDLSDTNAARLYDILAEYTAAARRIGSRRRGAARSAPSRQRTGSVRAWADPAVRTKRSASAVVTPSRPVSATPQKTGPAATSRRARKGVDNTEPASESAIVGLAQQLLDSVRSLLLRLAQLVRDLARDTLEGIIELLSRLLRYLDDILPEP